MRTEEQIALGLERIAAANACRNLMGRYAHYYTSERYAELTALWDDCGGCELETADGTVRGTDGIRAYYERCATGTGAVTIRMHDMDTEVIEVAPDGQTAEGCWLSPGSVTCPSAAGAADAYWVWQHYYACFVRTAGGAWRLRRLKITPIFSTRYDKSWADQPAARILGGEAGLAVPQPASRADGGLLEEPAEKSQLDRGLAELEAQQACRNLMGRAVRYHACFRHSQLARLWSDREDTALICQSGTFVGKEAIGAFFLDTWGDRDDPAFDLHGPLRAELDELNTEVLEIAPDGKTAEGVWISPGVRTTLEADGSTHADWLWRKFAVSFVRENGCWRLWKMTVFPMVDTDFAVPFTDESHAAAAAGSKFWSWTPDGFYPSDEPEPPRPPRAYNKA